MFVRLALACAAVTAVPFSAALAQPAHHTSTAAPTARAGRIAAAAVTFTATDFAFRGPDTVAAGAVRVRLRNAGAELHHAQLLRLESGKRLSDVYAWLKAGGPPPAWMRDVGGPNAPAPGAEAEAVVSLLPGRYAIVCFIPSPDGTPHVVKGMGSEFVVVGAPGRVVEAAADVDVRLTDYGFSFSTPVTAGSRTLRIRTDAPQSHEMFIARLAQGKTAADLLQWIEKPLGPPPGEPMGGVSAIAPGMANTITVTFTPGEYALYCFVPDAKDGKPHVAHGMVKQFTVR